MIKSIKFNSFFNNNYSFISLAIGVSLYVYSILISYYNSDAIEPKWGREIFSLLFIAVSFAALIKNRWFTKNYEYLFFGTLFLFTHYLIYVTYINGFSLDYLLGTYVVIFGTLLLLNSRGLIILFSIFGFIHVLEKVIRSDLDVISTNAILSSIVTILFFSFFIINANIRQRNKLREVNLDLDKKVKEKTKDLEKRNIELSQKNKDLEEFAFVVSHDLKQPLRNIMTLSEWLMQEKKDETDDKLIKINEQVTKSYHMLEGVLAYSLLDYEHDVKLSLVNLNEMVEEIVNVAKVSTIFKISYKTDLLPEITINGEMIFQVFQKLIQNSIQHNDKEFVEISIGYQNKEQEHLFSISDNGCGIDQKYHHKVFELFQKIEEREKSLSSVGVGLALVKKILMRMEGKIWLESTPKIGTTFFFTLPKEPSK